VVMRNNLTLDDLDSGRILMSPIIVQDVQFDSSLWQFSSHKIDAQ
jgi:hypothetical protein